MLSIQICKSISLIYLYLNFCQLHQFASSQAAYRDGRPRRFPQQNQNPQFHRRHLDESRRSDRDQPPVIHQQRANEEVHSDSSPTFQNQPPGHPATQQKTNEKTDSNNTPKIIISPPDSRPDTIESDKSSSPEGRTFNRLVHLERPERNVIMQHERPPSHPEEKPNQFIQQQPPIPLLPPQTVLNAPQQTADNPSPQIIDKHSALRRLLLRQLYNKLHHKKHHKKHLPDHDIVKNPRVDKPTDFDQHEKGYDNPYGMEDERYLPPESDDTVMSDIFEGKRVKVTVQILE